MVVAAFMIARRLRWPKTVDNDRLEARVAINGATPVFEMACRFSAPRHGASKRQRQQRAKYQWAVVRNRHSPLPVAGVEKFDDASIRLKLEWSDRNRYFAI